MNLSRGTPEFECFVAREYPRVVAAVTLLVGDRGVAEELAQDALVRAFERWGHLQQMAAPGAWLHRVAINSGLSWLRRRAAERRALRRDSSARDDGRDDAEVVAVRRAVARLPPRQRQAIVYRYYLGYSTAETAELMGIRAGSLKSAVTRAFTSLRADLGDVPRSPDIGASYGG